MIKRAIQTMKWVIRPGVSDIQSFKVLCSIKNVWCCFPQLVMRSAPSLISAIVLAPFLIFFLGGFSGDKWNPFMAYVYLLVAIPIAFHHGLTMGMKEPAPFGPVALLKSAAFWRVCFSLLLICGISLVVSFLVMVGLSKAWTDILGAAPGSDMANLIILASFAAAYFTFLYFAIRLCLLASITMRQPFGRAAFKQAWEKTSGNVFKVWGAYILASLPITIVASGLPFLAAYLHNAYSSNVLLALFDPIPVIPIIAWTLNFLFCGYMTGVLHDSVCLEGKDEHVVA